jgi:hypothetical protein
MQEPQDQDPYYRQAYPPQPPGPPARRRRRRGRRWLIFLVVLAVILIAADRIALVVAQNTLASKIQQEQHLSQKPDVTIDGFPFLTQVVSRDFGHATVDMHGLDAQGVPISDLHANLTGVHVSSGYDAAVVDTLTATATLNDTDLDAALAKQLDVGRAAISSAPDNRVKAAYELLGVTVTATIEVTLLPGNILELKAVSFSGFLASLAPPSDFDFHIPLGPLPFGLQLHDFEVLPTAIEVSATGHNVALSQTTVAAR